MGSVTRRALLAGSGALAGAAAVALVPRPPAATGEPLPSPTPPAAAILNDASELNPVAVARHVTLTQPPGDTLLAAIRSEIAASRTAGRGLAIGVARHSMGGQSLPVDGTAITLDQQWLELDRANSTYRVAAGVRWRTVIAELDRQGFSPAVMQSNNDFGVGSTFCVNAHGWPVPYGPFGSTVRSLRMVMADGTLVECSRDTHAELFYLAMGGYGLSGVIVDLVVDMVANQLLAPTFAQLRADDLASQFVGAVEGAANTRMAYGRLNVARDRFLEEALLITHAPAAAPADLPPASSSGLLSHASRYIYRAQTGSEAMKGVRWWMENELGPPLRGNATRNSLMNEPVATLADSDPHRCDILHEYFVPPERFADFLAACRATIPSSYQELMNVTLRYVRRDRESVLCFAPGDRIAAVMAFSQEKSVRAEADMIRMTRSLIDRVADLGGAYYLPYRLHATRAQLVRVYPRLEEFVRRKLEVDPARVFRNAMWDRYMEEPVNGA